MDGPKALSFIVMRILDGERDLESLKRKACEKFRLPRSPKNSEILASFPKSRLTREISLLLRRKPMRTLSGVAPIAVMVRPQGSCKWSCIYCPYTGKAPRSYTGSEPAAMRAISNSFDPLMQARSRISQFRLNGHAADKCDVIIMGGTFLSMKESYRTDFLKQIYAALNGRNSSTLEAAKRLNERAKHRLVGLTIETRPDVCGRKEIDEMLDAGATKVELGVQHPSEEIYKIIGRGHSVSEVSSATALLKDSAFKVCYHLMPGLPGSSPKKDVETFKKIFSDPSFRPDMLKIYPTLVIPGTPLYEMMRKGEYSPYSSEEAAEVIAKAYAYIPEYVRVMRIQRDIPAGLIAGGVRKSNLRELVEKKAKSIGIELKEMRSREAGLSGKPVSSPELKRLDYDASKGKEIFLSMEDKENSALAAFLRMRIPKAPFRSEITQESALVRELHVCGELIPLGKKGSVQHRGFGSSLLAEAERIASEEFQKEKMTIISAAGARPYYYSKGYSLHGTYVSKKI